MGNFDGVARAYLEVAVTLVAINAPTLRSWLTDDPVLAGSNRGLYHDKSDITVSEGDSGAQKRGSSTSACAVVALAVVLGHAKLVGSRVGVTGRMDLRGRVLMVGGVMEKVAVAKEKELQLVVIPLSNMEELEENDYEGWPHELKLYGKKVLRGVDNIVELLTVTFDGRSTCGVSPIVWVMQPALANPSGS